MLSVTFFSIGLAQYVCAKKLVFKNCRRVRLQSLKALSNVRSGAVIYELLKSLDEGPSIFMRIKPPLPLSNLGSENAATANRNCHNLSKIL